MHFIRTANTTPNVSIREYEFESFKKCQKSGIPQKSKQQSCASNESQDNILGDGYLKDIARMNEKAVTPDAGPSQKGSFRSDRSDIPPASREEF